MKKTEKLSKAQRRELIQQTLEKHSRFDFEYIPTGENFVVPDGSFKYRKPFPEMLVNGFWRTLLQLFCMPLIKIAYGAKVVGRENLKQLKGKGAFCLCNHISFLDTLFVRAAVGHYRSYHTMTERNNKKGLGGHIIRHGGMLPFSPNYAATKNLIKEMQRLLDKGKIINFYPERAMWVNYQKPRPMKEGVFTYAVKFNAPILPLFCTFEKSRSGKMKKLRIHILPAIFPDEGLPRKERAEKMKELSEKSWRECYERAYGKQLEYETK